MKTQTFLMKKRDALISRNMGRQQGAILVLAVLLLVILLGFAGVVLDGGRLYVLHTEMQNAADAAALAAAAELDGTDNARNDAVKAAKQLLSHKGRFATNPELLQNLEYIPAQPAESAFEFFSYINDERDGDEPSPCVNPFVYPPNPNNPNQPDTNKCLATSDDDAHYVRVKLDPALMQEGDDSYHISLYFLPVLGLFVDDPLFTASTSVGAVAGAGGPVFCEYPPMFMCAKDEGAGYPGFAIGQEIKIKSRDASTPWGPGNVGFLRVGEDIEVPLDNGSVRIEKNVDALAAAIGNEFIRKSCDEPLVQTQTGVITQKMRHALNTRFGLYEGGYEDAIEAFPPAPNTVDYPLDDVFSVESPSYNPAEYLGAGWASDLTECLAGSFPDTATETACGGYSRPETFSRQDYINYTHPSSEQPLTTPVSRHEMYLWEIDNAHSPVLDDTGIAPLDDRNSTSQEDCSERSINKPGEQHCWMHDGAPIDSTIAEGDARRRVLRIAVIKCSAANITGTTPGIDLDPNGEFPFHEFFITQHAQKASDTEFYVEYAGPVDDIQEIETIRHTIIQLYE